ncbi:DUF488 domain-containing protein [Azonexus sp.]|jgi:uncharacterized protein YeaO (DUF488 family)|uniref:DUF488 domain-containing protein n=1 Tax=Azonexus sp. TaxID=1872668 RepID=UPI00282D0D8E|nr:DUF488 domain-containing protein [Azonexus sp.]MDR1995443.1 DUF488 domain-containing protein [Azonexus sp.]
MTEITLKRIYEKPAASDGYRVLVDRLWPRGVAKDAAVLDEWNKYLAPSDALRKWFGHDPALWKSFSEKYTAELQAGTAAQEFMARMQGRKEITLLYAAHDQEHCHPLVLKAWLEQLQQSCNQGKSS